MALEWLKPILGEAYTDALDTQIAAEIGKGFVARADFNAKNEELKQAKTQITTHEKQLDDLKAAAGTTDDLKKQITELQEKNTQDKTAHEAELAKLRLDTAVDKALTDAGAKNNTAARALLAEFLKDAKLDKDGAVKGLAAELETLAKDEGTAFLFKAVEGTGNPAPVIKGMKPGEAADNNPTTLQAFETRLAEARKINNMANPVMNALDALQQTHWLMRSPASARSISPAEKPPLSSAFCTALPTSLISALSQEFSPSVSSCSSRSKVAASGPSPSLFPTTEA